MGVLDLGAGTGKHALEIARRGAARVDAVEVDSIAARELMDCLVRVENAGLFPEGVVCVHKQDAVEFLDAGKRQYDCVICYGLLHTLESMAVVDHIHQRLAEVVRTAGLLVVNEMPAKTPSPPPQPEPTYLVVLDGLSSRDLVRPSEDPALPRPPAPAHHRKQPAIGNPQRRPYGRQSCRCLSSQLPQLPLCGASCAIKIYR